MKTNKQINKKFDKKFGLITGNIIGNGSSQIRKIINDEIKAFIQKTLQSQKEEFIKKIPEEGIKWMQEGEKGFTAGFNFCRIMILKELNKQ